MTRLRLTLVIWTSIVLLGLLTPLRATSAAAFSQQTCDEPGLDAALAGGGTNTFNCAGATSILLEAPKTISVDGTILDGGGLLTISGSNGYRVFIVNSGVNATLKNLTIAHGAASSGACGFAAAGGAGIYNCGVLAVTNVIFLGNDAFNPSDGGAVLNVSGVLTVTNSTFLANVAIDNGGGIYNLNGTLSVNSSMFLNNSAYNGGGIMSRGGQLTVSGSTFATNEASGDGGAIRSDTGSTSTLVNSTFYNNSAGISGGAVLNWDNTMTVINSTFFNNNVRSSQGGGLINVTGFVTVTNTTIFGNRAVSGGGVFGQFALINSIVANNQGDNCGVGITNGGNNIDDGTSCGWGSNLGSLSSTNPRLGPLASNGGPTLTMALLPGSPAIDGVIYNSPNGCPATDQRGYRRPIGLRCDIGAFEAFLYLFLPLIVK